MGLGEVSLGDLLGKVPEWGVIAGSMLACSLSGSSVRVLLAEAVLNFNLSGSSVRVLLPEVVLKLNGASCRGSRLCTVALACDAQTLKGLFGRPPCLASVVG